MKARAPPGEEFLLLFSAKEKRRMFFDKKYKEKAELKIKMWGD
ncbi:MAG: hypothetical protein AAB675_03505 [Patescibacteria group bacterium]